MDPREQDTLNAAQRRHAALTELFAELSGVNTMLNQIDARLKTASPARAAALRAFKLRVTYDARNIEDLSGPAQLREGLLDLISRMSTSFQTPTAAQLSQVAEYRTEYAALSAAYQKL